MALVDPIEDPNFHPMRARPANPTRIARIKALAKQYRAKMADADVVRAEMAREIREAKAAGHSYPQLAEAAGVSMGVIQRIVGDD